MKGFVKFGHTHTCICGNSLSMNTENIQLIGCDFKHKNSYGFKGYLWYKNICDKCNGIILHGESYADFRVKNEGLLFSAIQTAANKFSYQAFHLLSNQYGKRFQSKFIKPNKLQ